MSPEKNPVDHELDDDEALSWGESADSSYVEGPARGHRGDETADDADGDEDELPEGVLSSGMLVAHGVFAAILLLYTVAWLLAVTRATAPGLAGASLTLWHLGQWLAVFAPALWFAATLSLTPASSARRRVVWLLVGVIVLIPWQFVYGGTS
ncbi:hypothetical protein EDF46_0837 [Frondihabitans sp. PhB188]|uniref:hypothetical protein n=1 Tax=Frondihabitans sp. PhB188 TaxID=2485200 RepID=UPI000F49859F|nr:hypothetical protein [Frondihabitans sp. PhB188]ROQ41458.1 hypothetical protein EDF46_0837 [Frondihabitans sp. PhB188]